MINKKGFTLVELIVVVSILAILSAVGFVAFSGYLSGVRDTNRVAQLVTIHDGLSMFSTKYELPIPDKNVEVNAYGNNYAWQGYAGENVLSLIDYGEPGLDPKSQLPFTYFLTKNKQHFQLATYLEEDYNSLVLSPINNTFAYDYSDKFVYVYGKSLGIITEAGTNTPAHEISAITDAGKIDVGTTTLMYNAHLDNDDTFTGTGGALGLGVLKDVAAVGGRFCSSSGSTIDCIDPNTGVNLVINTGTPPPPPPPGPVTTEVIVLDFETSGGYIDGHYTGTWNDIWTPTSGDYVRDSTEKYEGTYSLRRDGGVNDNSYFCFRKDVTLPSSIDDLSFHMKISSEEGADFFQYYVDNFSTPKETWSGEIPWMKHTDTTITAGVHSLMWCFRKDYGDAGLVAGQTDQVWIDKITYRYTE